MTTIKLKNGSGAPTAGDLVQGEPALDLTNKRLYTENASGTVIEVGTNPTSITTGDITATGTATFANLATSGDITFGDNDKAVFGAGSDLQIYHDGTDSYVDDQGTGRLRLRGASQIILEHPTNGETYAAFQANGASTLYYDNAAKLATTSTGIDVTGSVTADGITSSADILVQESIPQLILDDTDVTDASGTLVQAGSTLFLRSRGGTSSYGAIRFARNNGSDTNALDIASNGDISFYNDAGTSQNLFWDASTSRLGLGTTSPAYQLDVQGSGAGIRVDNTAGAPDQTLMIFQADLGTNDRNMQIKSPATDSASDPFRFTTANSFAFEIDSNASAFVIDSAARVGIGTSSPGTTLHLSNSDPRITLTDTDAGGNFQIRNTSGVGYISTLGAHPLIFVTNSSEQMRIDSSGNVGIGTNTPGEELHINASVPTIRLQDSDGTNQYSNIIHSNGLLFFYARSGSSNGTFNFVGDDGTTQSTFSSITENAIQQFHSSAWYIRNRVDGGSLNLGVETSAGALYYPIQMNGSSNIIRFDNANGEMARFDTNGNLLFSKTALNIGLDGVELRESGAGAFSRTSDVNIYSNRNGTDGSAVDFRKNNSTVGTISVTSSATSYNTSSDQRLKDNIVDAPSASDDIDAIQVRSFDWKADGSHQKYGMVAQELNTVAPEAVSEGETEEDMMGVDYSKLVPMLVKEIQSLRARVAQLEND